MSVVERLLKKAYVDAEGPLGFPMQSEAAKDLEQTIEGLDSDCRSYIDEHGEDGIVRVRATPVTFELMEGERADVSLITTDSKDRDGEIVMPGGGNWKSFTQSGGPVTFAHKYSELPVGRAAWVKRVKDPADGWLAKTLYKAKPTGWSGDWFPDAVFSFVQDGMRGKSIGFIPTKGHRPTEEDVKSDPRMAEVGWVIDKWVGLEYAVTPIQSNPDAVTIAVSKMRQKGLYVPDIILDEMGISIPIGPEVKAVVPEEDADPKPVIKQTPKPVIVTVNGRPIGKDSRMSVKPEDVAAEANGKEIEEDGVKKNVKVLTKTELLTEMANRLDNAMSSKGTLSPVRMTKRILDRMKGRV